MPSEEMSNENHSLSTVIFHGFSWRDRTDSVFGRREIGHGALTEYFPSSIIPSQDLFLCSIRMVSDILHSNGSLSIASIYSGCLAPIDARIPIIRTMTEISVGLVTLSDHTGSIIKHIIRTDIRGTEDHFGYIDLKFSGTRNPVTSVQLDLKFQGLPVEIAKELTMQSKSATMDILDILESVIPRPRESRKQNAPKITV
jgi:polyribonucleotide nucleotidyltransferase